MTAEQSTYSYLTAHQQIAPSLPGSELPWMQQFRAEGLKAFEAHGFPNLRDEEWRYTNLSMLNKTLFVPVEDHSVDADWLDCYRLENAWSVVLVNGRFAQDLSNLEGLPADVTIHSLRDHPESAQNRLGRAVANDEHSLIAFNSAWFSDGLFIDIAAKQQLAKPLQILYVVISGRCLGGQP